MVHLLHPIESIEKSPEELKTRERAAIALRNVVLSLKDDPRGRQEVYILRILEQLRCYSGQSKLFSVELTSKYKCCFHVMHKKKHLQFDRI